jgi:amidase
MTDELTWLDATAHAHLVRTGQLRPIELVDAAIARIEAINPQLNAVIIPLFEQARARARQPLAPDSPFCGVPLLVKDLICQTKGDPYHAGMRLLRDRGWRSDHDTYLAAKFRAAGFICVGRTNVPELGPLPTTEPLAYGPTRNPWDTTRSPGGSSGGSAAAVASGMVPVAHGNDGGGSIRIPASACGLVGLKPSHGRTSLGPDAGDTWNGAVAEHVLARSVRDTAAILDAVAGPMPGDPCVAPPPQRPFRQEADAPPGRLRIGLLSHAPAQTAVVHPDCIAAADDAARLLASLGHHVEPAYPAALDDAEFSIHFGAVVTSWTARDLDFWSAQTGHTIGPADVEPHTWELAHLGRSVSAAQYIAATVWLQGFTRRVAAWWADGFDLLLTPTMAEPPPILGELTATPDDPLRGFLRSIPLAAFTAAFNVTGQPALSVPLYWNTAGVPIGAHLVAAYGREDLLIRVGAQLEQARPWSHRRPPVHA